MGTDGPIDWYCSPRFDSPSVFAAILDRVRGGYWRIAPAAPGRTSKQLYFPDTNILITRFLSAGGVGEVQDFMPIASSPAHPPHCLIRRVTCVRGRVEFETAAEPRFGYGRQQHALLAHPRGVIFQAPGLSLALASPRPLTLTRPGRTPGSPSPTATAPPLRSCQQTVTPRARSPCSAKAGALATAFKRQERPPSRKRGLLFIRGAALKLTP